MFKKTRKWWYQIRMDVELELSADCLRKADKFKFQDPEKYWYWISRSLLHNDKWQLLYKKSKRVN